MLVTAHPAAGAGSTVSRQAASVAGVSEMPDEAAGVPPDAAPEAAQGPRLLGPADIRQIAGRLGIRPAKRLGQNFVIDAGTVRRITALAGLDADDVVLEVGPGLGSLTLPLLAAAASVVAVEVDEALAAELPRTVAERAPALAGRLHVVTADAARVRDLPGQPTVLAANLPYSSAVPIMLHLLATVPSLRHGVCHGAGRGRRPDDRPAGQQDLWRALGQARLVRRGPQGRAGATDRVLAGAQGGLRPGGLHPAGAATRRGPRRGVRGRGRGVRAAAQDAARRAGAVGGLGCGG